MINILTKTYITGRVGNIRDVSQLLLNLAVNEYMTDSTQVIDGGYLLTIP